MHPEAVQSNAPEDTVGDVISTQLKVGVIKVALVRLPVIYPPFVMMGELRVTPLSIELLIVPLVSEKFVKAPPVEVKNGEIMLGEVRVLLESVSVPATVAMVPLVGRVTFVAPVNVNVMGPAEEV